MEKYEVKICAIDKVQPELMEFDNFSELLDECMILGASQFGTKYKYSREK